jgi:hypothetical protein
LKQELAARLRAAGYEVVVRSGRLLRSRKFSTAMFDLFGHPIPKPELARDPEAEQRCREVVLVVKDGFPAQSWPQLE